MIIIILSRTVFTIVTNIFAIKRDHIKLKLDLNFTQGTPELEYTERFFRRIEKKRVQTEL